MAETLKIGVDGNFAGTEFKALGYYNDAEGDYEGVEGDFIRASDKYVPFEGILRKYNPNEVAVQSVNSVKSINLEANAATNYCTYSKNLANDDIVSTGGDGSGTITRNYSIAPTGDLEASRFQASITDTASTSNYAIFGFDESGAGVVPDKSISVWMKSNTGSTQYITLYSSRLTTGDFDFSTSGVGGLYLEVTTEWKRFTLSGEYTGGASGFSAIVALRGGVYYAGNDSIDVSFFQGQLENTITPSSDIITNGSTATREADQLINFGNSNIFNSEEGVFIAKFQNTGIGSGDFRSLSISDGSLSNRIVIQYHTDNTRIRVRYVSGGATIYDFFYTPIDITEVFEFKFKYKSNDFGLKINNIEVDTQTTGATASDLFNTMSFSSGSGVDLFSGSVFYTQINPNIDDY